MTQKLITLEGATQKELTEMIQEYLVETSFNVKSCSVIKTLSGYAGFIIIDDVSENIAGFE